MNRICILILMVLVLPGTSCHPLEKAEKKSKTGIMVEDFRGKTLRLEAPPERVVCLIESALSGIYMLGAGDRVVGVPVDVYKNPYKFYYAQLDERIRSRTLPGPGNWDFVSLEQIVGLEPDLVIIWSSQTEAIDRLEDLGIPVYAVMLHDFQDVMKEIRDFGTVFNTESRAEQLIDYTTEQLSELRESVKVSDPPSVYFMWAQGIQETSGTNSTVNDLLTFAGTVNACPYEQEHLVIHTEQLFDWDPDLLVMWPGNRITPGQLPDHSQLRELRAVKDQRVHVLPGPFLCDFWTLKLVYSAGCIAEWAYPGTNINRIDPEAMLEFLYGQKINIYEP